MSSTSSDVIRGTLDMLILKVLANEAEHGWGICERIQQVSTRRAASPAGIALRLAASHDARRLDPLVLGHDVEQPAGALLRDHARRTPAAPHRIR